MIVIPPFPEDRLRDPQRQAELAIYREFENNDTPGTVIYEAKPNRRTPEVDFAIWIEGVGRYAMQVKGGIYRVAGTSWFLSTPQGEIRKPSPLAQIWASTMKLHDSLKEGVRDNRTPFLVAVLSLPDMERDEDIEEWADHTNAHVVFGTDHIVERLIALAPHSKVLYPPTADEIEEEVALVIPRKAGNPPVAAPVEFQAREVVIQHADQVTIYTTGGDKEI